MLLSMVLFPQSPERHLLQPVRLPTVHGQWSSCVLHVPDDTHLRGKPTRRPPRARQPCPSGVRSQTRFAWSAAAASVGSGSLDGTGADTADSGAACSESTGLWSTDSRSLLDIASAQPSA